MKTDLNFCNAIGDLGKSFTIDEETYTACERFICALYGGKGDADINDLRYKLFCGKNPASERLPPNLDCLKKHIQRANYQAAIWCKSLEAMAAIPNPNGNGWILNKSDLLIDWMDMDPAPDALLELIVCNCQGTCGTNICSCYRNNLGCSDACHIGNACTNDRSTTQEDSDDSDSDEDV